jgi:ATP/maltotriose-dependent transcriptional regulator MalT
VPPLAPPLPDPFVGRTDEVAHLVDRLGSVADGRAVAIHGPVGVGKSALAAQVARTCLRRTGKGTSG